MNYAQRNAASELAAVTALAPSDLIYKPGPPQFSALVASVLGNAGTPADGFDGIFAAVAGIIEGDIAALGALDTILTGIEFVPGALDGVLFAPIVTDYTAFVKAGAANLTSLDGGTTDGSGGGSGGGSSQGNQQGGNLCKRRFPYGVNRDDPGLGDPCAP